RNQRDSLLNEVDAEIDLNRTMDVALWKCKIDKYKKKFSTNDTWGHIREAHPSCISWSNGVVSVCHSQLTKGMLAEKYTMNWICITHLVQPKDMPDGPDHALFMLRTSLCDLERKE
ncbi:hypothetical protein IGI04_013289, partial [Brassica rapa subsp. trilocularis]